MPNNESYTKGQASEREALVDTVFTPATPIQTYALFAGRAAQVEKVYGTMMEAGRHAILHGERGVGKTSLANIVSERLVNQHAIVPKVSADSDDTFQSLWSKVFARIIVKTNTPVAGFLPQRRDELTRLSDQFEIEFTPAVVVDALSKLPLTVVMVDEFDRVESTRVGKLMADTIKGLSDVGTGATILIVGVADDVSGLVGHHPSIERSIREIRLQRMAPYELEEILDTGFDRLELKVPLTLRKKMVNLSHGFPHYTHVLGKYAALYAFEHGLDEVTDAGFRSAVERSIEDTYRGIQDYYLRVTSASNSKTLPYFLLAAAVAQEDE
jgi:Cdc6-like AAA superfamily ATPase